MNSESELKIAQLRNFLLVSELGSFQAAAERACRTQPAVWLSIRELESRLGQPLFEKGGRLRLTPFGEYCLPRVQDLLGHHDRLATELRRVATGARGQVGVAAVPSVACELLPHALGAFAAEHPDVDIRVRDDTARHVCRLVGQRRVDFGLASLEAEDAGLDFEPLFADAIGLVCRRDHLLARRKAPLRWADLSGSRMIANGTQRLLSGAAAEQVRETHMHVSNMLSLGALLAAGLGVTTLPALALPRQHPELCFIPLCEPALDRTLGIITPRGRSPSPAARALLQQVRDCIPIRLAGYADAGHPFTDLRETG